MAKTTHVTTSRMPRKPGPSIRSAEIAGPPSLKRNIPGQNKTGRGKPH